MKCVGEVAFAIKLSASQFLTNALIARIKRGYKYLVAIICARRLKVF